VRFLIDENLSPIVAELLTIEGHDSTHVRTLGLAGAPDEAVLAAANSDDRILISADTDFGQLLARSGASKPSVLLLRRQEGRRAAQQARFVLDHLDMIEEPLESGAIVVLDDTRVRIRALPLLDE
jgi:predicted nuclease of predicted toxin-antitoxin system